jgi:hypothetical protein
MPDYDYYLDHKISNTKLIISSHGGWLDSPLGKASVNLHFLALQNYTVRGQVSNVLYMALKEFENEKKGTGGLTDYLLSYYQHDKEEKVQEAVAGGYDVIRIKQGRKVKLSKILSEMKAWKLGYTDVYCMFCRVPLQAKYVQVMF